MRSAEADRKIGNPEINVVHSELEALRIDIKQGTAKEALPEIEAMLEKVRKWWNSVQKGQSVPEAPDRDSLDGVLIGGLDIAYHANLYQENWQNCLNLLSEIEEVKRSRGDSEHEIARPRFNRYFPLIHLNQLIEAKKVLEEVLPVFRKADNLEMQSKVLGAMADGWHRMGDLRHAIELERQSIVVSNTLSEPLNRAMSHSNLSVYLHEKDDIEEGARHLLAGMIYRIVINNQQDIGASLHNLAIFMQESKQQGKRYPLPRVRELLGMAEFSTLNGWLSQWGVDVDGLQGTIDEIVGRIR